MTFEMDVRQNFVYPTINRSPNGGGRYDIFWNIIVLDAKECRVDRALKDEFMKCFSGGENIDIYRGGMGNPVGTRYPVLIQRLRL